MLTDLRPRVTRLALVLRLHPSLLFKFGFRGRAEHSNKTRLPVAGSTVRYGTGKRGLGCV